MMARKRRSQQRENSTVKASPQQIATAGFPGLQFNIATLAGFGLLLALATTILYLPVTDHPFINYDDSDYITDNPNIQSGINFATLKWAATSFHAANWHPLTWLVHAVDFQLYGADAGGHHATSMVLHAANVVLLFLLLAMATKAVGRSFFVAALFATHPLNVESVAWAAELKNILSTFFFLLTLGAYGWYARKPGIGRYLLVLVLFFFGLASKPMVITLPFVLLLLDFWPLSRMQNLTKPSATFGGRQSQWIRLILEKIPLFTLSAFSAWITIRAQSAGEATTMIHPALGLRLANAVTTYVEYITKIFLPFRLAPFYPFPSAGVPLLQVVVTILVLLSVTAFVFRFSRERPYLLTGWLWFLGTLAPVIGILQVGAQARADRYCYIPMMGVLLMIVWGFSELAQAKKLNLTLQTVAPLAIVVLLSAVTVRQISYWSSSYDLWTHTIAVTQNNATAEHNLSIDLIRSGRIDEVYPHLRRAVELEPADFVSRVNLGNVYSSQGRHQEALHEFVTVLEKSDDPKLLLPAAINAGWSYRKLADLNNAEASYRLALRISPGNPSALQGLKTVQNLRASSSTSPEK